MKEDPSLLMPWILKEYLEHLSDNKLNSLREMGHFFVGHKLSKLIQGKMDNTNSRISI